MLEDSLVVVVRVVVVADLRAALTALLMLVFSKLYASLAAARSSASCCSDRPLTQPPCTPSVVLPLLRREVEVVVLA